MTPKRLPVFTCKVRDITERRAVERRRETRLAVTETLAMAANLAEAGPRILRAVCEVQGWDMGVWDR